MAILSDQPATTGGVKVSGDTVPKGLASSTPSGYSTSGTTPAGSGQRFPRGDGVPTGR